MVCCREGSWFRDAVAFGWSVQALRIPVSARRPHQCSFGDRSGQRCQVSREKPSIRDRVFRGVEATRRVRGEFAANQHTRGVVQICDAFWPYVIPTREGDTEKGGQFHKLHSLALEREVASASLLHRQTKGWPTLSMPTTLRLKILSMHFCLRARESMSHGSTGTSVAPLPVSDTSDPSSTKLHRWIRLWTIGATSARA